MMPVVILAAYVIGSVPFALLLSRRAGGQDLRRVGSGNLGAANVLRAAGLRAGIAVALLDIAKGALSVALARQMSDQPAAAAVAGLAAIVGHIYPVWLRFRGGKGVATACGVFSVLTPMSMLPALAVFALTVSLSKYISLASVLGSITVSVGAYLSGSPRATTISAIVASTLIVFRHRTNLARLQRGRERRFGARELAGDAAPGVID